jgi:hypothetical protein
MDRQQFSPVEAAEALLRSIQPAGAQPRPGIPTPPLGTPTPRLAALPLKPVRWRTGVVTETVASLMMAWGTFLGRALIIIGATFLAAAIFFLSVVYALCR